MAKLRIQGLSKAFRDGETTHQVLSGLDLEIEDGQFVALLGRSGSGKSTLLNCLAGIETPDAGSIVVDDVDITKLGDAERTQLRRDRIGIIFQFFNLLPMMPVLENVALPALLAGKPRREVFDRAHSLLQELGLEARASEMPDHLSGGEQQRVATARALINEPAFLLADEPTGNLDAGTATRTLDLLKQVNASHGVTILLVTHSEEAARSATRIANLIDGRIEWAPDPVAATEAQTEAQTEADAEAGTVAAEVEQAPKKKKKKGPPKGALFKSKSSPSPAPGIESPAPEEPAQEPTPEPAPEPTSEPAPDTEPAPATSETEVDTAIDEALGTDDRSEPAAEPETPTDPAEAPDDKPKPKVRPSAKAAALFQKTDDES